MSRVRERVATELPELRTFFQSGGLVDSVLNQGAPGADRRSGQRDRICKPMTSIAEDLARQFRALPGVSDVYVPQDMDYPALQVNVDRDRASELGLDPKEVIDNLITSLTSDAMIAPSYWVDPKSGNNYFVTVQYPENQVKSIQDLKAMPLRSPNLKLPTYLNQVADVNLIQSPTEVDHYQLQRSIDVYVAPSGEDLGRETTADQQNRGGHETSAQYPNQPSRLGGDHAILFQEFWLRASPRRAFGLSGAGRAVHFVCRSHF